MNKFLLNFSFCLLVSSLPLASFAKEDNAVETQVYKTANSQLYQAQKLLDGRDDGGKAYELLRDLLKNDNTINSISRKKIQKAANKIENYRDKGFFTNLFNYSRFKERPHIEARYLLGEAIMDSRIAINESSDSEILFIDKLLKNYFYPGSPEKVTIHYPDIGDFAFDTWALSKENLFNEQIGASTEELETEEAEEFLDDGVGYGDDEYENFDLDNYRRGIFKNAKGDFDNLTEDDWLSLFSQVGEQLPDFAIWRDTYKDLEQRVRNRYLFQSMLVQAIAEPGAALLDPQLQAFLKGVRIEIDLGDTDGLSEVELAQYKKVLGEGILKVNDEDISIDLTKLYSLNRVGTTSNLKLQMEKEKTEAGRVGLSIVSGIAGEDLMFLRYLQVTSIALRDTHRILRTDPALKTINFLDKVFDSFAALSETVRGTRAMQVTTVGSLSQTIRGFLATFVKLPSKVYDGVSVISKSKAGQALSSAIRNNKYIQNGKLLKGLVGLSIMAELTAATIEYQYIEKKQDKYALISETGARVGASASYLVPVLGQVTAAIDLADLVFDTGFETADVLRGVGKVAAYGTLAYYGYTPTTLKLSSIENAYKVPRHNVHLELHGAWIDSKDDAQLRQVQLIKEMETITLNNLIVLYRAHRSLDRGANTDFGERIYVYSRGYDSNIKVMKNTQKIISDKIREYKN